MIADAKKSYVFFPLGEKRFALPAEMVTELARTGSVQTFPHCTPLLAGVLMCRGRIVPVCDVAQVLVGPDAPARKFYLIANRQTHSSQEWTAIPVTGECELASAGPATPSDQETGYICGVLVVGDETVEIVDLEKLISMEAPA